MESQYTIVLLHPALYSRKAFARQVSMPTGAHTRASDFPSGFPVFTLFKQVELLSPNFALLIPDLPGMLSLSLPDARAVHFSVHVRVWESVIISPCTWFCVHACAYALRTLVCVLCLRVRVQGGQSSYRCIHFKY